MNDLNMEASDIFCLKLSDPLTIQNINNVKNAILNSLEHVTELNIDHEQCSEFDLTYLQLLVSAKKTAMAQNKHIILKNQSPESLISLARDAGLFSLLNWLNKKEVTNAE